MDPNELQDLRELVEFLKANDIAEFDLEKNDLKVRLKFMGAVKAESSSASGASLDMSQLARLMASAAPSGAVAPAHVAPVHTPAAEDAPVAATPMAEMLHIVKSPIVGTFYESPSPGSSPFVKVGDQVEAGQILCIVEAMKLMNEIESDAAGELVERIVSSGQPVEYGQPLFRIRTK